MSHPIINVGRYHGGSDDWRTPYRLFRNLHREFGFTLDGAVVRSPFASCVLIYRNVPRKPKVEITQTIYCGDTMLLLAVVNRGGFTWKTSYARCTDARQAD